MKKSLLLLLLNFVLVAVGCSQETEADLNEELLETEQEEAEGDIEEAEEMDTESLILKQTLPFSQNQSYGNITGNRNNGGRVAYDYYNGLHYISLGNKIVSFDAEKDQINTILVLDEGSAIQLNISNDYIFYYNPVTKNIVQLLREDPYDPIVIKSNVAEFVGYMRSYVFYFLQKDRYNQLLRMNVNDLSDVREVRNETNPSIDKYQLYSGRA